MVRTEKWRPRELNAETLGYIAGLIDGEGWIGLTRRKRKWKRRQDRTHYLRPVIVIGMATREALDFVASVLGLGVEYVKVEGDVYRLRIYPTTLRWLLPQLTPHLRLKRRHAEVLQQFVTELRYQGKELTVEQFLARERLGEEIHRLNERPAIRRRRLLQEVT